MRSWLQKMVQSRILLTSILIGALIFQMPQTLPGEIYTQCYLINKKGYDQESLKAYKSLDGYRLHWDGHVYNLQRNKNIYFEHHIIKFSVKPTEREKTPLGNKPTYDGWIIIQKGGHGVVLSAHCPCIGG